VPSLLRPEQVVQNTETVVMPQTLSASTAALISASAPDAEARGWVRILAGYREPHLGRSLFELAITLGAFISLWIAMWFALKTSYA
jgi:hypothetical protein